jgi:hypothetical protein
MSMEKKFRECEERDDITPFHSTVHNKFSLTWGWAEILSTAPIAPIVQILNRLVSLKLFSLPIRCNGNV